MKYRLKKDLPNAKAGADVELVSGSYRIKVEDTYDLYIYFSKKCVENSPDWFEPIQEKEYTESDMIEFATSMARHLGRQVCIFKTDLNDWLKSRSEK